MAELFPIIQPRSAASVKELPLYKEAAWDFVNGRPVFQDGSPVFVTGKEAVKVWIWKALVTPRTVYDIYSWSFGNELESLMGQNFTKETKLAEANRYIREALEINPYIAGINDITVEFAKARLTIHVRVTTIYGEVTINV
ncbi:DUF2634 domain-containing protein [Oscillospiraceae bacterium MB08-C2-2]|nr:DUF2634 domain-containing protein [Oscillospiraceae bacterium MB08-C2-2]